jgi:hypothetical protein
MSENVADDQTTAPVPAQLTLYVTSPTFIKDMLNDQLSKMKEEKEKAANRRPPPPRSFKVAPVVDRIPDEQKYYYDNNGPSAIQQQQQQQQRQQPPRQQQTIVVELTKSEFVRQELANLISNKYLLFHCLLLVVLGALAIGFQVALTMLQYSYYYLGLGFLVGLYFWALVVGLIIFCKQSNPNQTKYSFILNKLN